jgi:hypothetical protein
MYGDTESLFVHLTRNFQIWCDMLLDTFEVISWIVFLFVEFLLWLLDGSIVQVSSV